MTILFGQVIAGYAIAAVLSLLLIKWRDINNIVINLLSAVTSVYALILAFAHLTTATPATEILNISSHVPFISIVLKVDQLSAFFILCLAILSLCVSIYSIGYMKHYIATKNIAWFNFLLNIFILSIFFVITSSNLVSFLISWEIMSIVSYALVVFESDQIENSKAGLLYIIMTHLGTALLIIAFMLLYINTGSLEILPAGTLLEPALKNALFILFLLGFSVKAGIIPLHIWLPHAHPAAPSNVSALMSGIMIKTAVYGLLRFILIVLGAANTWWGVVILALGAVSTVLGIAYALMEHNYKRLLAYSSIENIGIIMMGIGISLIAYSTGSQNIAALALSAALYHILNHMLFKGALFMGAGNLYYATHTKNLEELGGLMKRMPYTGLFMLLASLAISALPPFNGFISEWLTLQSLFQLLLTASTGLKIVAMLSVTALAMSGAMAVACFIKFTGITFLGLPRSEHAQKAREVPIPMLVGTGLPVLLCLALGLFPQNILKLLNGTNIEIYQVSILPEMKATGFLPYFSLDLPNTGISVFAVVISALAIFIFASLVIKLIGRRSKERIFTTWDCGFGGLNSRMQYTATGFSKPLRIVFRILFRPARKLSFKEGPSPYYPTDLNYRVSTEPVIEKYIYYPVALAFTHWARKARFFVQTGSVHIYLLYIFVALILLLIYNLVF